jgi:hypothetical protein
MHKCVTGVGGSGCVESIYRSYALCIRIYKIALPPQTKTQEGRGPQTDKHLPQSPFTNQFLRAADI